MKKYLLLCMGLLVCPGVYAAQDELKFNTTLSAPVGSFTAVETMTCSYPNLKGKAGEDGLDSHYDFSNQVVLNFGPSGKSGTVYLNGGPLNIDTLLLEDTARFESKNTVWMVGTIDPSASATVELYPKANLQVARAFINTLVLPVKDAAGRSINKSSLDVHDVLRIGWINLETEILGIPSSINESSEKVGKLGDLTVKMDPSSMDRGAVFQSVPGGSEKVLALTK